jgi:hypothetical protein
MGMDNRVERLHQELFDELERQGAMNVDVGRLTVAVLNAQSVIAAQTPHEPYRRCANGGCDD